MATDQSEQDYYDEGYDQGRLELEEYVIERIDKRIETLNNFDEFEGNIPKDEETLRDLIVQYYNDLKNEIISKTKPKTLDVLHEVEKEKIAVLTGDSK
jgi:hypothetical protein